MILKASTIWQTNWIKLYLKKVLLITYASKGASDYE